MEIVLFISGILNISFLLLITLFIARKGGISYLSKKLSDIVNPTTQDIQVANPTYYLHQTSLFQILPKSNSEIIFLGDSITDECEWTELLENLNIKNRGISGDTTNGILNRLDDILELKPNKIFLMIGINEFIHYDKSAEQISEDYKKIITKIFAQSPNTDLFVQSVLPVNQTKYGININNNDIIKLNLYLREIAQEYSVQYIDLFSHLSDSQNQLDSRYTLDGLHLNGQAYLVWKKVVEKYIAK